MGSDTEQMILQKLDEIREQRYKNGITMTRIEGRVKSNESYIDDHKEFHKEETKYRRSINLKMWLLIVGMGATIIISVLKDQIF